MTERELVRIGLEIRRRRQVLGWTLEQFAEACSLTPNHLGTIEAGRRDVPTTTLLAIARALECSAGDLFSDPKADLSAGACEIGKLYDQSPAEAQEAVAQVLRVIKRNRPKAEKERDTSARRRRRPTELS